MRETFDVCIVGAGPGGLAALSAMTEPYSLDQLSRDQWNRVAHVDLKHRKDRIPPKVCVVDPGGWLSTWHARFKALQIQWLRSPVGAHPDIFDMHSLLAFATRTERCDELLDSGAVNADLRSLPEAGQGLWNLPSNELFEQFCGDLAARLPHSFIHGEVTSVEGDDGDFTVFLKDGQPILAQTVILALGVPGPAAFPGALAPVPEHLMFHSDFECGARLQELSGKKRVLVIGGGLTAVQVAQLALKKDCEVVLLSRRPLTTRHFDIGERWFDRRRANVHHYEFFQKPMEERLEHIKATRGGGSVPPFYMKEIREAEASGRLVCKQGEVQLSHVWAEAVDVLIDGQVNRFDLIVNACGHRADGRHLPLVRELLRTAPTEVVGGFPVLSQDLQWGDFKQLFVVGALASLQVGPDAGNLMGLRRAVQIVANALSLRAWLKDTKTVLGNICGNRFQALDSDSDSECESV
ncbi:Hypothetical protein (Fragment) [Durusdinium trenchii]|uniref:FAD/NAD(P)-binding domain-containing protein n=3 Tax=Durusdinium trenchii TaxID=1381693 RepID=A0ABP0RJC6_9DINO